MFWGIIHRMILVDLIKIFLIALIALTGLILMAGVIAEAMKSGLGPLQILYAIPLMLPGMLPYTVPTTALFATCIVYGRLSADSEILALKAAGVHIMHVILPALLLGIAAAAATMFLYIDTIPYTQFLLKCQIVEVDVEDALYTMLRKDGCIVHKKLPFEMIVGTMRGKKLFDVNFQRRKPDGMGFDLIAHAKEAEMMVDSKNMKILIDMRQCEILHINDAGGDGKGRGIVTHRIWEVDIQDFHGPFRKSHPREMTWNELNANERRLEGEKQKISRDIDLHQSAAALGTSNPERKKHIEALVNQRKQIDNQLSSTGTERHMRIALALGCICFALVGCPVGIWFSKSDYLSAFITCFLPVVTIYYPLLLCTINLGRSGRVPAIFGVYDADLLMLFAGLLLMRRLVRN